jgi:hypothetical protein
MSKTLTLSSLTAEINSPKANAEDERATFKADDLTVTVTDPEGNVVMTATLEPRGFKAKQDKRSGRLLGGIGWYGDIRGDSRGEYKGLPLSGGLRISVDGVKVQPGDVVDLTGSDE